MALVELQLRRQAFLNLFKNQINQRRLPGWTLKFPGLDGYPLQRIECVDATVDPSDGAGQITVSASLVIHYSTSLTDVEAAGSLKEPATSQRPMTVPVNFQVAFDSTGSPTLKWAMLFGLAADSLPFRLPKDIQAQVGAIDATEEVVCIRLGTQPTDALNGPVVDRTEGNDWAQLVPGQIIADMFARNFADALQSSLDNDLVLDKAASGAWFSAFGGFPPFAGVSATVVSVDACLGFIDVSVDLQLRATLAPTGPSLMTTVTLSWDADSTVCDIAAGLLFTPIGSLVSNRLAEDKASQEMLGKSKPFEGFHEIGHTDDSITYQQRSAISTASPRFVLTGSESTNDGLVTYGRLALQSAVRNLEGEVIEPSSGLKIDCTTRSVTVQFSPPRVYLRDMGASGGAPVLFAERVLFQPPNAWTVVQTPAESWLDLEIVFADPPAGRLPAGIHTSVFLFTDCGLRWADLGVIPARHADPTVADMVNMISECMAISDPWGMGIMNLGWLVDPPDFRREIDPVREWVISVKNLPAGTRLEFVARRVGGQHERHLATVDVGRDLAVYLVTDATETVQIRTREGLSAPAPRVTQRWIVPFAEVSMPAEPLALASIDGVVGVMDRQGVAHVVDVGFDGRISTRRADQHSNRDVVDRLRAALDRATARQPWVGAPPARIDSHTVAVVSRGRVLIGRPLAAQQL
jgi:hypothetical protein